MSVSSKNLSPIEISECNRLFSDLYQRYKANRKARIAALVDGRYAEANALKAIRVRIEQEAVEAGKRFGIDPDVAVDYVVG